MRTFVVVNQSFFSMGVFLEQCSAVLDGDTGGTRFFINLVKRAFSIKCVSLNLQLLSYILAAIC